MNKILLFSCLMISILPINGMKRGRTYYEPQQGVHKKQCTSQPIISKPKISAVRFDIGALPQELQNSIMCYAGKHPCAPNPKEAIKLIRCLAITNRHLNQQMRTLEYTDEVIYNVARQYHCSHETIAKYLHTTPAYKRLELQYSLRSRCYHINNAENRTTLKQQLNNGGRLDFTYNHCGYQKNLLMICSSTRNNTHSIFLKNGADVNGCNSYGYTPLMFVMQYPINSEYCDDLLSNPELKINQQNNRGETALLYTLLYRKKSQHTPTFFHLIGKLLELGADPELADKKGNTPLSVAFSSQEKEIIDPIKAAIRKKHSSA